MPKQRTLILVPDRTSLSSEAYLKVAEEAIYISLLCPTGVVKVVESYPKKNLSRYEVITVLGDEQPWMHEVLQDALASGCLFLPLEAFYAFVGLIPYNSEMLKAKPLSKKVEKTSEDSLSATDPLSVLLEVLDALGASSSPLSEIPSKKEAPKKPTKDPMDPLNQEALKSLIKVIDAYRTLDPNKIHESIEAAEVVVKRILLC